jgi:hypothetical protein
MSKRVKVQHFFPLVSEQLVERRFDVRTGELRCYVVQVCICADGRVDIQPGERVRVTVERIERKEKRRG